MKKRNVLLMLLLLAVVYSHAQEHQPEIHLGGNIGIAANNTQVVVGLDGELLYPVDYNFNVGVATGLIFTTRNNGVMLPLALSGRYKADATLSVGMDLGYALPINNSSSSLYVRPMLGYKLSYRSQLRFSYTGLNNNGYLNVGILFRLHRQKRSLTISY